MTTEGILSIAEGAPTGKRFQAPCEWNGRALFAYQTDGIDLVLNTYGNVLLADPPGAGKTAQAIVAADMLGPRLVLVVCPAILRANWEREIRMWATRPSATFPITSKKDWPAAWDLWREGDEAFDFETAYFIASYDLISGCGHTWDLAIFDEAHYLKNPKAQRTKHAYAVMERCPKNILITGTPLPNGKAVEAHPTFGKLAPSEFGQFWPFVKRYTTCIEVHAKTGEWDFSTSRNLKELGERARKHFMIRRKKTEILSQLPPLTRQTVPVECKAPDDSANESLLAEALEIVEKGGPASEHVAKLRRELGLLKIQPAVDFTRTLLDERDQVVVFAHHVAVVTGIFQGLRGFEAGAIIGATSSEERQKLIDQFQGGSCRVLVLSLTAANVGITLTKASTVVMAEWSWVPSDNEQAEARCHRIGQEEHTQVFYLTVPDSIDEAILSAVLKKQRNIREVLGD